MSLEDQQLASHKRKRAEPAVQYVTLAFFRERIFKERQTFQAKTDSLQRQIEALQEVVRMNDVGRNHLHTITKDATSPGKETTTSVVMREDHPLFAFVRDCLIEAGWARSKCGAVRRAYELWYAANHGEGKPMHHIAFSREMRTYWQRKGCSARSYYQGIQLK